jgi:hypothetical protein
MPPGPAAAVTVAAAAAAAVTCNAQGQKNGLLRRVAAVDADLISCFDPFRACSSNSSSSSHGGHVQCSAAVYKALGWLGEAAAERPAAVAAAAAEE